MDAPIKITSAHLRVALQLRYPRQSHALMFEVAPETGGGTRYADAVAVGLWRSHGHKVEGFEIKVSRSDFLNELKQPEKSQPVFRFCNHWWLVAPKGLVQPAELPEGWGLLELQENGSLRERVKAAKLEPERPNLGFFASLCRRAAQVDHEAEDLRVEKRVSQHTEQIREAERARADRVISERGRAIESAIKELDTIKEQTGVDFRDLGWRGGEWLQAVRMVEAMAGSYGPIFRMRQAAEQIIKDIDAVNSVEQFVEQSKLDG